MINNSNLNIGNQKIYIYNLFSIILIALLFATSSLANEDSKKCVVYKDGKLMYNPDNPKIHCTTLQILDNYWEENNVNVPNQNKKPEEFAEVLTEKEVISNGKTVCKNPSTSNANFKIKEALEGETISGTCDTGYTGTVSATCKKSGSWDIDNKCLGDCKNLNNMYTDSNFINAIETISNNKFAYSKCKLGYSGYIKHKCDNGKIGDTENLCILNTNYCQKLTNIENGSITYNNNQAINSIATLKCNTGYEVNGNNSIVCSANSETNGKWNTTFGSCTPKTCSNPTTQANANAFTKTSLKYNETAITATCKTGYTGTITATCEANGNWKYNGNCSIVRCPTNLTATNGSYPTITTANNTYNTTITGTCNTGYIGTISATCNANGTWVKSGSCTKNESFCPSISVANGYASYSDSRAMGSVATLKCNSGYDLSYNPSRAKEPVTATCQSNGQWSNALEDCYKRCDVYFTGNIYICTNRGDYWCAYSYDPKGDCNLRNKWDNCHVENQMNARHGQTVNYSTSCYFRLYAGKNGGGADSSCKDDRRNVGYWVTCTNGTYTVYPKE